MAKANCQTSEEEQYRTTDQFFTLARKLEGAGDHAHPVYMCFVNQEKAPDRVSWDVLWEMLQEYGVRGSLG